MEMQQSGRLQNDGGAENACRAHEKGPQSGDDTIRGAQIGRTLAAAIEDPQLMFDARTNAAGKSRCKLAAST
jgi:hypothetical protein